MSLIDILDALPNKWRLNHPDGRPYLTRTVLQGIDCLDNHDYSEPLNLFLHHIHTADSDRDCHNHCWRWSVAVILSGGYTERRPNQWSDRDTITHYSAGDYNFLLPTDYHSVIDIEPGTTTLFLCGAEFQDWGFLVDGIHVPHAEYFKRADAQHMTTVRLS